MDINLSLIKRDIYDPCGVTLSNFQVELESQAYNACQFKLNDSYILCRSGKITPKKIGQFVTFYKRNSEGIIEPFSAVDCFDFYSVNVRTDDYFGQFVFPKQILIDKGIVSTRGKEGKRAFRVYPEWDVAVSKQAKQAQKWQLDYFYRITNTTDFDKVKSLYALGL